MLTILLFASFLSLPVDANVNATKVIRIIDGDTLVVLNQSKQQVKIRLNAIDAPEKSQPFSKKSTNNLKKLCLGKVVNYKFIKLDKYGRTIADVWCDGVNANANQVALGLAWVFRKYSNDQQLIKLESIAKKIHSGLWDDPSPVAPWDWRDGVRPENFQQAQKHIKQTLKSNRLQIADKDNRSGFSCTGRVYCRQMRSCAEARFHLTQCGMHRLDRDHDGIPCESICGH